ncbi:unnamed protein product [Symbiodinium pilosum]|uniref:Uncharacterized protein n=1 Tax=Symbiodinium pilosum TaxID=2952 RepID=A0A812JJL9_SYMPI|nr:unnamed protein product [Symbiodinium pilosum]
MASDAVVEKNLAKLDAVMRKTKVFVASADRRILRSKAVVKGRSWPMQLHGLRPPSEASSSSSGTVRSSSKEASPSSTEKAGKPVTQTCSTASSEHKETLTFEDLRGTWVDADGNNVHVAEASNFGVFGQLVATITRPPLRQLRLELWQPEGSFQWRCGSAVLSAHANEQLIWRFPGGKVSTWLRKAAFEEGQGDQAWLAIWDPEYGYGPWGLSTMTADQSVSLNDFAWMLSNGATNQMMTPKMQEDGIMVLVPLTDDCLQKLTR